jgi:hypothetical protein
LVEAVLRPRRYLCRVAVGQKRPDGQIIDIRQY